MDIADTKPKQNAARFVAALILVGCLCACRHGQLASPIKRDETVVFFDTSAWLEPSGTHWIVPIHGWIYEPADSMFRKGLLAEEAFLSIVRALDPSSHTVVIVGHDPLFSSFAHFLDEDFTDWLPTCGVVRFTFKVQAWAEVTHNSGTVRFFISPKHEDPWIQPSADEIASHLTDQ